MVGDLHGWAEFCNNVPPTPKGLPHSRAEIARLRLKSAGHKLFRPYLSPGFTDKDWTNQLAYVATLMASQQRELSPPLD